MLHVIQDHGGSVEGLAVADVPGRGRGLLAATKLAPGPATSTGSGSLELWLYLDEGGQT